MVDDHELVFVVYEPETKHILSIGCLVLGWWPWTRVCCLRTWNQT